MRAHGTRTKYVHEGCRCLPCSDANRDYGRVLAARQRKPWRVHHTAAKTFVVRNQDTKEIRLRTLDRDEAHALRDRLNRGTPTDTPWADETTMGELREHLAALRALGVGLRQVARLSGVGRTRLQEISEGVDRVRDETAQAVLSVPLGSHAPKALVPAEETWRLIEEMLAAGATRTRISHALGNKSHGLQLRRDLVTKASADKVREVHDRFFMGSERMRSVCRCEERRAA